MYISSIFRLDNEKDKIAFMKRYSFATIITNKNGIPLATQLPFTIRDSSDKLVLTSHFALANEQAKYIEENISLVIFSEPHAYISPSHYDKFESVPTWDYIAIHAYGRAKVVHEEGSKLCLLEEMIGFYEKDYKKQWEKLPENFKQRMMKGIVAFELDVTELQGQQKLSQNKTAEEKERIIKTLESSKIGSEKELASYIRKTMAD
ncbi:FMN-binding negative transcriptional regulator [Sphingobacterium hotanense]|uniref:FMN-binding negative transcriptional regulator n=1 Tax=Sphingobacterium hotanense TaxID=649196 RepID=A0ABT7NIG0_9SPHI|nr:FMN-binding negative transcriptional regulator [Sphingobacterium hotanense]MDM1046971.1 FMN-binding negative transcriptional regulator [Sphingobacterium hotanense]